MMMMICVLLQLELGCEILHALSTSPTCPILILIILIIVIIIIELITIIIMIIIIIIKINMNCCCSVLIGPQTGLTLIVMYHYTMYTLLESTYF